MADQVLYSGVACITDLMVKEGLINLDFADVRAVMREMGKAMMGTGEASGEKRALRAAEAAISNPLIDDVSMKGAKGLLISITGGNDLTLYEVDEAATRIREEVDRTPTSSSARPSTRAWKASSACRWWRPASIKCGGAVRSRDARMKRASPRSRSAPAPMRSARRQRRPPATVGAGRATACRGASRHRCAGCRRGRCRGVCRAGTHDDLTIRPIPPKPSLFVEPIAQEKPTEPVMPAAFIPPQAERRQFARRACRGSTNCRCRRRTRFAPASATSRQEDPLEKPRMSLLQRLASVGLGRREDGGAAQSAPAARARCRRCDRMPRAAAAPGAPCRKPSRCRSSPSGRRRRGSTRTAGRPL